MLTHLDTMAEAAPGPVGTVGYCMGGRLALNAIGHFPDRIRAMVSMYGGALHTDQPDSPHLLADRVTGEMYFGVAENDAYVEMAMNDRLRAHLDAEGLQQVEVEVVASAAASRTPVSDPWVDWAAQSMARSTGKSIAILPNLAGTLPNDVFSDILGLPTLWVPHSYPACAQHAPNEHLLVDVAREGLQIMGGLFWDLGNTDSAPWPTRA